MKEKIEKVYIAALYEDMPPSVFSEQILAIIKEELLNPILSESEEIISNPIRFNGTHVAKIETIFEKAGVELLPQF